jgi:hypothetical protein
MLRPSRSRAELERATVPLLDAKSIDDRLEPFDPIRGGR